MALLGTTFYKQSICSPPHGAEGNPVCTVRTQDWRGELSLCAASLGSPLYWIQLKVLWCVYESLNKAPGHRDQDYICPDCVLVEIDSDRDIFDII
jgi:hypothetical protein